MKQFDLRPRPRVITENRCVECGHEWRDRPVGFAGHHECPKCGSLYWKWQNYAPDAK